MRLRTPETPSQSSRPVPGTKTTFTSESIPGTWRLSNVSALNAPRGIARRFHRRGRSRMVPDAALRLATGPKREFMRGWANSFCWKAVTCSISSCLVRTMVSFGPPPPQSGLKENALVFAICDTQALPGSEIVY